MEEIKKIKDDIGAITSRCIALALAKSGGWGSAVKIEEEFLKEFRFSLISDVVDYLKDLKSWQKEA